MAQAAGRKRAHGWRGGGAIRSTHYSSFVGPRFQRCATELTARHRLPVRAVSPGFSDAQHAPERTRPGDERASDFEFSDAAVELLCDRRRRSTGCSGDCQRKPARRQRLNVKRKCGVPMPRAIVSEQTNVT
jgi:hypothetical protein